MDAEHSLTKRPIRSGTARVTRATRDTQRSANHSDRSSASSASSSGTPEEITVPFDDVIFAEAFVRHAWGFEDPETIGKRVVRSVTNYFGRDKRAGNARGSIVDEITRIRDKD